MWSSGLGRRTKRLMLQCINGVSSNPVEGITKNCQLKDLILINFQTYIYIFPLEIRICAILLSFIYYVLPLEIQISRAEGWYPINWVFLCPSQDWDFQRHIICRGLFLCLASSFEMRGDCSGEFM
jgi:hypothetical protein